MSETTSTGEGTPAVPTAPVEPTTVDELPEFARNIITGLRQENAKHRTAKSEAVEAAKLEAQTAFEATLAESTTAHEATRGELAGAQTELLKLQAALSTPGVLKAALAAENPGEYLAEFASLLQGSNAEEIAAHAGRVTGLLGNAPTHTPAVDPSQGLGDGGALTPDDPFTSFMTGLLTN